MIPNTLHPLFWDIDVAAFQPSAFPDYAIFRVLEYGDRDALAWLRQIFDAGEICRVIRTERRMSRKSATFWALVYGIPDGEVAALTQAHHVAS